MYNIRGCNDDLMFHSEGFDRFSSEFACPIHYGDNINYTRTINNSITISFINT